MSVSCLPSQLVFGCSVPHIRGHKSPSQAQKTTPNTPKLTTLSLLCSDRTVRGHPGLKSPSECLYHVVLPSKCLSGPHHTFGAIRAFLRPKNEPKYAQTNQICLCPCSNSIVRDCPSLKFPRECLYHVCLPCWCRGGP